MGHCKSIPAFQVFNCNVGLEMTVNKPRYKIFFRKGEAKITEYLYGQWVVNPWEYKQWVKEYWALSDFNRLGTFPPYAETVTV